MHFDISTVQCKHLNSFSINGLRLEFFFCSVEDSDGYPVSESSIDGVPFAEFFGHCSPSATVFRHVSQGAKKGVVIDHHIATLTRK
jgi:hypothetical protein